MKVPKSRFGDVRTLTQVYATSEGSQLALDLTYFPAASVPTPLVIWIHGGAWRAGSRDAPRFAAQVVANGIAMAAIDYRLSQTALFPAQIVDCRAAVRWLRAHATDYRIDPDRFASWGASAGGHLSALLAAASHVTEWDEGENLDHSAEVQAAVDWFGPVNFIRMNDRPGTIDHDAADSPESQLIGKPIQDHPEAVRLADPLTYLRSGAPPFCIAHGEEDLLVIPEQSVMLADRLRELEVPHEFHLLPGLAHGGDGWQEAVPIVRRFLLRQFGMVGAGEML